MMAVAASRTLARLVAVAIGAAIQVAVVLVVMLIWRHTAGSWRPAAWAAYLVGFCLIAPLMGMVVASRLGQWQLTTRQLATSVVLVALLNVVFALSTPGFAEASIGPQVYVSGYCAAMVVLFAAVSTQAHRG